MRCPNCNSKTKVIDSRYRSSEGWTYRRHQCINVNCNLVFSTREDIVGGSVRIGTKKISRGRRTIIIDS